MSFLRLTTGRRRSPASQPGRLRPLAALAAGLVALVLAPSPAEAATPKQRDRQLERILERLVAVPGGPPGVVAVVQRRGERRVHAAGVSRVGSKRRIHKRDSMRIASVSKAFNGAVALALVDRGDLRLDDTIGEHRPDLPAAWSQVTLRQLLNHTSGVPSYTADQGFLTWWVEHLRARPSPGRLLGFVAGDPLAFKPGSEYEYSNSDNLIVALIAEAVTGKRYEQLLAELVNEPLGLRRTRLPAGFRMPRPLLHGYDLSERRPTDVSTCCSAAALGASGGIRSTPAQLNRFGRGYVGGELFGDATRREQRRFVAGGSEPPGPGRNSAGLALFRYRTNCGTVFGHTGNFFGYTQLVAASGNGRRSVTLSASTQLSPEGGNPDAYATFRRADRRAVCAALARRGG